ncbi:MAG: hypothetical protein HY678_01255, partial [Chloroflexi bacterium]|nr:hypothetical protein [Chloroflexota bacterium]
MAGARTSRKPIRVTAFSVACFAALIAIATLAGCTAGPPSPTPTIQAIITSPTPGDINARSPTAASVATATPAPSPTATLPPAPTPTAAAQPRPTATNVAAPVPPGNLQALQACVEAAVGREIAAAVEIAPDGSVSLGVKPEALTPSQLAAIGQCAQAAT